MTHPYQHLALLAAHAAQQASLAAIRGEPDDNYDKSQDALDTELAKYDDWAVGELLRGDGSAHDELAERGIKVAHLALSGEVTDFQAQAHVLLAANHLLDAAGAL